MISKFQKTYFCIFLYDKLIACHIFVKKDILVLLFIFVLKFMLSLDISISYYTYTCMEIFFHIKKEEIR